MNRHLNVFIRYQRVDHHEDQLTRAAMIVLRLVPAAREALLRLIDAPGISQLASAGDVDMQTSEVIGQGDTQNELVVGAARGHAGVVKMVGVRPSGW